MLRAEETVFGKATMEYDLRPPVPEGCVPSLRLVGRKASLTARSILSAISLQQALRIHRDQGPAVSLAGHTRAAAADQSLTCPTCVPTDPP
jgi:hypothetical protein